MADRSFPVTDDLRDAPDGALVYDEVRLATYERVGMEWCWRADSDITGGPVATPVRVPCSCGRDHSQARRCPHRGRHWFTVYGHVGLRKPNCECGAPNPNWTADMQADFDDYMRRREGH